MTLFKCVVPEPQKGTREWRQTDDDSDTLEVGDDGGLCLYTHSNAAVWKLLVAIGDKKQRQSKHLALC